jgi:hypothetical protein
MTRTGCTDDGPDEFLAERVPVTRTGDISRMLGSIEATLIEMRLDIQAGTRAQSEASKQMVVIDRRVEVLESDREVRIRVWRFVIQALFLLLLPTVLALNHLHEWYDAVNKVIFPSKTP